MNKVVFICHSVYLKDHNIFDPNYAITFEFLDHYFGDNYAVIRHSLYKGGETRIYGQGLKGGYRKIGLIGNLPDFIRYFFEIIFNFLYLVIKRPDRVIAIDPLSGFAPVALKKLKLLKKVLFITPDFARRRFNNSLINQVYFLFDRFCTINANVNLCCAQSVIAYKQEIYKNLKKDVVFFHLPNTPNPWIINKFKNIVKTKNRIIYVGNISSQIDFEKIFDSIFALKNKYPDISFFMVGSGDQVSDLKGYIKTNGIDIVHFLGQLSYEDTLAEIAKSEIGIALYNGGFNYDEFRDSCKIRDYQALAVIPMVSSVVKSNSQEILQYQSGLVIDDIKELPPQIDKVLSDARYKKELQDNAEKNHQLYKNKFEEFYSLLTS